MQLEFEQMSGFVDLLVEVLVTVKLRSSDIHFDLSIDFPSQIPAPIHRGLSRLIVEMPECMKNNGLMCLHDGPTLYSSRQQILNMTSSTGLKRRGVTVGSREYHRAGNSGYCWPSVIGSRNNGQQSSSLC